MNLVNCWGSLKNKFAFSDHSLTGLAAPRWQDFMSRGQKSWKFFNFPHWSFVHFCPRSLNANKTIAIAICPISLELSARARCLMGMWICVRSKDAQRQLARTSLMENLHSRVDFIVKPRPCLHNYSYPIISFYLSKSHRFFFNLAKYFCFVTSESIFAMF